VEDLEAAFEIGVNAADRKDLAIDQHDAVLDAHFVRQRSFGDRDLSKPARLCRVGDVDDARAVRWLDVPDIGDVVADNHLATAGTIEIADDLQPFRDCHWPHPTTSRSHYAECDPSRPLICDQNATMQFVCRSICSYHAVGLRHEGHANFVRYIVHIPLARVCSQ